MIVLRGLAIWCALVIVESIHGAFRRLVLEPRLGDLPARQLSVVTGSLLIVLVTGLLIRRLHTSRPRDLLLIGLMWAALTFVFEVAAGRYLAGYSWERVWSDFNILEGGLLPFGLAVMALAPWLTARWRARVVRPT